MCLRTKQLQEGVIGSGPNTHQCHSEFAHRHKFYRFTGFSNILCGNHLWSSFPSSPAVQAGTSSHSLHLAQIMRSQPPLSAHCSHIFNQLRRSLCNPSLPSRISAHFPLFLSLWLFSPALNSLNPGSLWPHWRWVKRGQYCHHTTTTSHTTTTTSKRSSLFPISEIKSSKRPKLPSATSVGQSQPLFVPFPETAGCSESENITCT